MDSMFVVVTPTGSSKNLFVGDILRNDGPNEEDLTQYVCKDLVTDQLHYLTESQIQPASNEDIFGAFISKSGGWVFHKSKNTLDYLARVEKIDIPYLHHATGNDMIYNFIPATDVMIYEYRFEKAVKKGFKIGVGIIDANKVKGTLQAYKLDPKTKDLIVCYQDEDDNEFESPIQKVKLKKYKVKDYPVNT